MQMTVDQWFVGREWNLLTLNATLRFAGEIALSDLGFGIHFKFLIDGLLMANGFA